MSEKKSVPTIVELRADMERMQDQFAAALTASGIPLQRFLRVLLTAMQNPALWECDRQSLKAAAMAAAQDNLLPDGREGAIAPFREDGRKIARWMPMIRGLRKKVLDSGEVASWDVYCVRAGDQFQMQLGDDPRIFHQPLLDSNAHLRPIVGVYSVAKFRAGGQSLEHMTIGEVEQLRTKSRATRGPWHDKVFYSEMVRKTVARRHAKRLPMNEATEQVFRRDDDMYDLDRESPLEARQQQGRRLASTTAMLDSFAASDDASLASASDETSDPAARRTPDTDPASASPAKQEIGSTVISESPATPQNFAEYEAFLESTCANFAAPALLREWYGSTEQRSLRNHCGIVAEQKTELDAIVRRRISELSK